MLRTDNSLVRRNIFLTMLKNCENTTKIKEIIIINLYMDMIMSMVKYHSLEKVCFKKLTAINHNLQQ